MRKIETNKMFKEVADSYDKNAIQYQIASKRELRKFVLKPSLIKHLGNLSNKRILDIGCGTGDSCELSISCGAQEVIGIDISEREILIAKRNDQIKYVVRNGTEDLTDLGNFDLVTAILSIHYCADRQTLKKCFTNIKKVLSPTGKFVAVVVPFANYEGYGVKIHSPSNVEGELSYVSISDFSGNKILDFSDIYWSYNTYREILLSVGFSVKKLPCLISTEGTKKFGSSFWRKFEKEPLYCIFQAEIN